MALGTMALVTFFLCVVMVAQPAVARRCLVSIAVVDILGIVLLELNRRGWTRLASAVLVGGLVSIVTTNALPAGGVRSPGVGAYIIFILMATVLLGRRGGIWTAAACSALTLGLAVAERMGALPLQTVAYGPLPLWLLYSIYIGLAVILVRMIMDSIERARDLARSEAAERRQAERTLACALESAGAGAFELWLKDDAFQGDARALAIFGLSGQPGGRVPVADWANMIHAADRPGVVALLDGLRAGTPAAHTDYRITRPDGKERYIEAHALTVTDDKGMPARIVGLVSDVTDQKLASREREKLLLNLGERVKELRLLHSAARLMQSFHPNLQNVFRELAAQMPAAWTYPAYCEARIRYKEIEAATPGWRESPWRQSATFKTSAGEGAIEVVYLKECPLAAEGPFIAEERSLINSLADMLGSYIERDLAEGNRRALEWQMQQTHKMEALGTLAGGITHDFNNILTAILGNIFLARAQLAPDNQAHRFFDRIGSAGERAKDLVQRILLFSRKQQPVRQEVDISKLIEDVTGLLAVGRSKKIKLHTRIASGLPNVFADANQIFQVLLNLGTNAAYAMKNTNGELLYQADVVAVEGADPEPTRQLKPGEYLRLAVSDTGTGMAPEVMSRLFEPFYTTKGKEGTGLGLSLVHGIVKDHGGAITVESELGKGTTFRVYLPSSRGAAEAWPVRREVKPGRGQNVVYVDDDEALVHVMERMLQMLGYRCAGYASAQAALAAFEAAPQSFDAVLTDAYMPEMTGQALADAIWKIRPAVPIVLFTGTQTVLEAFPESNFAARIQKPASLDQIGLALQDCLAPGGAVQPE